MRVSGRYPALVAGLALVASLVACGGGTDSSSADTGNAGGTDLGVWKTRDELIAAANKEGSLKVLTSFVEDNNKALQADFMKLYPGIKTTVDEQQNDEGQKTLLELQAGQIDYDILHLGKTDGFAEFFPHLAKLDLVKLVKDGVIKMPEGSIHPKYPNIMAAGSGVGAVAWNPDLIADDEVPDTYEGFLDPKFKGKFMVNIEGEHFGAMFQAWGEEKTLDYTAKLAKNSPVWTDSDTAGITVMAAGEHPIYLNTNYHSAFRAQKKQPDKIHIKALDVLPGSFTQLQAIRDKAEHPAAAVLFLEFLMSPQAQQHLDELEPVQASFLTPSSNSAKLIAASGAKASIVDWEHFHDLTDWSEKVQKSWGFPSATVKKK